MRRKRLGRLTTVAITVALCLSKAALAQFGNGDYDGDYDADYDVDGDDFANWAACMAAEETDNVKPTSARLALDQRGLDTREPKSASPKAAKEPMEWQTYTDKERHFSLQFPSKWKTATGLRIEGDHRSVFLTLNSPGKANFWLLDQNRKREPLSSVSSRRIHLRGIRTMDDAPATNSSCP